MNEADVQLSKAIAGDPFRAGVECGVYEKLHHKTWSEEERRQHYLAVAFMARKHGQKFRDGYSAAILENIGVVKRNGLTQYAKVKYDP